MGIFIDLSISKSITLAEWASVYQEALTLAQKLQLAEYRNVEIGGVPIRCLAVTQERSEYYGTWEKKLWTGFNIDGDYATMETGEDNGLPGVVCKGGIYPHKLHPADGSFAAK